MLEKNFTKKAKQLKNTTLTLKLLWLSINDVWNFDQKMPKKIRSSVKILKFVYMKSFAQPVIIFSVLSFIGP